MAFKLFLFTLPFWIMAGVSFTWDLYLDSLWLGMLLKLLLPFVLLINVTGIGCGIYQLAKDSAVPPGRAILGIILNSLPLFGIGGLVFWFLFIFRM